MVAEYLNTSLVLEVPATVLMCTVGTDDRVGLVVQHPTDPTHRVGVMYVANYAKAIQKVPTQRSSKSRTIRMQMPHVRPHPDSARPYKKDIME